jgi:hypothetical protein
MTLVGAYEGIQPSATDPRDLDDENAARRSADGPA